MAAKKKRRPKNFDSKERKALQKEQGLTEVQVLSREQHHSMKQIYKDLREAKTADKPDLIEELLAEIIDEVGRGRA